MKDLGTTVPEVIKRMAVGIAPDYPNVESVNTMEQLYVISETITGSKAANEDLHAIIDTMKALLREWFDEFNGGGTMTHPLVKNTKALLDLLQ